MYHICFGMDADDTLSLTMMHFTHFAAGVVGETKIFEIEDSSQYKLITTNNNISSSIIKKYPKNEKYIFYRKLKEFMKKQNISTYPIPILKNGVWYACSPDTDMCMVEQKGKPHVVITSGVGIEVKFY